MGTGMGTRVNTRGRKQDGSGGRCGDGKKSSSLDGNGDGNEDRIEESGGETKTRKKPLRSCRRDVENVGDLDEKRKKT